MPDLPKAERGHGERHGLSHDVAFLLKGLRLRIQHSQLKHYQIDQRAGFSRGYLSQLLSGAIDLKYKHLMAILHALKIEPSEFFGELFPRRGQTALASLGDVANRSEGSPSHEIARLFGSGIETVLDLVERVARCEAARCEAAIAKLTELRLIKQDDGERT
jgi:transcriptional regulator with XRE-family HTH domain